MSLRISARVFVPELVLNSQFVRFLIVQKMQSKSAPDVRRMFEKTTVGWSDKPDFLQKFTNSPSHVSAEIWAGQTTTGGKIYNLVNNGTAPHTIVPRRAKMLRFQVGYRRATQPRVLSSRAPSRFGFFATSFSVEHPGSEPRDFDKTIVDEYMDTFIEDMQEVVRVATVRK